MVYDHGDFLHSSTLLSLPAEWEVPQFRFGQHVVSDGRRGTIAGLWWTAPDSGDALIDGNLPGWWYVIAISPDQPSYKTWPALIVHETVVQASEPRSALSHELLTVA